MMEFTRKKMGSQFKPKSPPRGRGFATKAGTAVLACAFLLAAIPAYSQDIFVRPGQNKDQNKNNDGKPSTADLGMKPRTPPAPPPQVVPQPVPVAPPPGTPQKPGPAVTPPPGGGTQDEYKTGTQHFGNADVIMIDSSRDPVPKGAGPNSITVSIQPGMIGSGDKQTISSQLGLSDQEIMANCFFRHDALITSNRDMADYIPVRNGAAIRYNYSSPLNSVEVYPSIACRKLRNPVSGTIIEDQGFYSISLPSVSCDPGAKGSANTLALTFRYVGNGQGQCTF